MYWWKELLFVSSYKVCFLFQNFVSCSVSYNINWIVTQIGFFPGPHICSKALTGVGRGITSPFHGDFYFNFHLSWLMCKSWMLQRLEKLICLVRSFSMSCDIFDLHICQDRWKLENWCLLLTQVDCRYLSASPHLIPDVCKCPGDDQTCSHQEHRCGHTARRPHQGLIGTCSKGGWQQTFGK